MWNIQNPFLPKSSTHPNNPTFANTSYMFQPPYSKKVDQQGTRHSVYPCIVGTALIITGSYNQSIQIILAQRIICCTNEGLPYAFHPQKQEAFCIFQRNNLWNRHPYLNHQCWLTKLHRGFVNQHWWFKYGWRWWLTFLSSAFKVFVHGFWQIRPHLLHFPIIHRCILYKNKIH